MAASLLFAPAARADTLDKLVVAAAAADLASSEIALSKPGTSEANPLAPTPPARVALKVAGTAGILLLSRKLSRRGSRILKIATIVVWSGVAVHNLRVQR